MELAQRQEEVNKLLKNIQHPRLGAVLGLQEEIGELVKEIMEQEIYGADKNKEIGEELADVIFSVLDVANAYSIDMDSVYQYKIDNTRTRIPKWEEKYSAILAAKREKLD